MRFRHAYGEKFDCSIDFSHEETLTREYCKDECDINRIIERYTKNGVIDHLASNSPIYGDFTEVGDYHHSLMMVQAAQESFSTLPAKLRDKFENDPGKFLDFINTASEDELVSLGLANKRADISTQPDPVLSSPSV